MKTIIVTLFLMSSWAVKAQEKIYKIDSAYLGVYENTNNLYNTTDTTNVRKNFRIRRADTLEYHNRIFVLGDNLFDYMNIPEPCENTKKGHTYRFSAYRFVIENDSTIKPVAGKPAKQRGNSQPHVSAENDSTVYGCWFAAEAKDARINYSFNNLVTKKAFIFTYSRKTGSAEPNRLCDIDSVEIKKGKFDDPEHLGHMLDKEIDFSLMEEDIEYFIVNTAVNKKGEIVYVNVFGENKTASKQLGALFKNMEPGSITHHFTITTDRPEKQSSIYTDPFNSFKIILDKQKRKAEVSYAEGQPGFL